MEPILELKNINYAYHTLEGETKALTDISFSIASESLSPVGPSQDAANLRLLSITPGLLEPEKGLLKTNGKYLREMLP